MYIIDRYTYYALEFLETVTQDSKKTMGELLEVCPKRLCISTVGKRTDLFARDPKKVPITDFFGSVRNVELTTGVATNASLTARKRSSEDVSGSCDAQHCGDTKEQPVRVYAFPQNLPILDLLKN